MSWEIMGYALNHTCPGLLRDHGIQVPEIVERFPELGGRNLFLCLEMMDKRIVQEIPTGLPGFRQFYVADAVCLSEDFHGNYGFWEGEHGPGFPTFLKRASTNPHLIWWIVAYG